MNGSTARSPTRCQFHRAQDLEVIGKPASFLGAIATGIKNGDPADPSNGAGKANEGPTVKLIGPAETVDDTGNGAVGLRIAHVVGELEILGDRTVLVLSFRGSQIYGCPPRSCLKLVLQEKNSFARAHGF